MGMGKFCRSGFSKAATYKGIKIYIDSFNRIVTPFELMLK